MKMKMKIIAICILSLVIVIALLFISACNLLTQSSVSPQKTSIIAPSVDTKALIKHVKLLSETYYPRSYSHLKNLNASAAYIKQQLSLYSDLVSEQAFNVDGTPYYNIIAHFGPVEGTSIVIGAHYDSFGMTKGADDNASGVAGLLELARLFKENPPPIPIELVAYTLEEPPFFRTEYMGSAVHARSLVEANKKIKLMISLEMIGYFSDEPNSQHFPVNFMQRLYSDKGNFIAIISNMDNRKETAKLKGFMLGTTDLSVFSLNAPAFITGIDFSDHLNYWANDFPAVMITDTSFFRNHAYHEVAQDTWDKLDYQRMAKVIQAVYVAVLNY